jgi:hypothetical protein
LNNLDKYLNSWRIINKSQQIKENIWSKSMKFLQNNTNIEKELQEEEEIQVIKRSKIQYLINFVLIII